MKRDETWEPLGELGKMLTIDNRSTKEGNGQRVWLRGVDYGPILRVAGAGQILQLWRAAGYSTHNGRPSMVVREYYPVEWWVVRVDGVAATIVEILRPKRGRMRDRWRAIFDAGNYNRAIKPEEV